jgi:hypothetical protein
LLNPDLDACAIEKKGVAYLFFFFGGCCVAAVVFISKFLPETAGVPLEEIAEMMG